MHHSRIQGQYLSVCQMWQPAQDIVSGEVSDICATTLAAPVIQVGCLVRELARHVSTSETVLTYKNKKQIIKLIKRHRDKVKQIFHLMFVFMDLSIKQD